MKQRERSIAHRHVRQNVVSLLTIDGSLQALAESNQLTCQVLSERDDLAWATNVVGGDNNGFDLHGYIRLSDVTFAASRRGRYFASLIA